MPNVTKKDLIDRVVDRTRNKRVVVKEVVQELLDVIVEQLGEGHRIELRDFGVFEVKERKERIAQNPKTLEKVIVPAKRSVRFKAGRLMKDRVDGSVKAVTKETKEVEAPIVEVTSNVRSTL